VVKQEKIHRTIKKNEKAKGGGDYTRKKKNFEIKKDKEDRMCGWVAFVVRINRARNKKRSW